MGNELSLSDIFIIFNLDYLFHNMRLNIDEMM